MKNWKPILGIILTFFFGAITGGFAVGEFARRNIERFIREGAEDVTPIVVKRLGSKLDLTGEQKEKLTTIVNDGQNHLRDIRKRVKPEVRTSLSETVDKISAILTPEQKKKFEAIIKRGEQHFGPLKD